jgi:hypothetical protein
MPRVEKEPEIIEPEIKKVPVKIKKKRHTGLATFAIVIASVAILTIGLEMVVTARTQSLVAAQVEASLKTEQTPSVIISMHPILYKFFAGRIDRFYIKAEGFKMKYGAFIDTAEIELKGVKFGPMNLIKTKQMAALKSMDSGTARIVLSEQAVNDLVAERLPGGTVKLEKGAFRYVADMPYVLPGVTINALGDVTVMPDNTLRFKPKPGELEKLDIPQDIKDYLISALAVDYKLEDVPPGIELSKVTIDTGRLIIDADILDLTFLSSGVSGASN